MSRLLKVEFNADIGFLQDLDLKQAESGELSCVEGSTVGTTSEGPLVITWGKPLHVTAPREAMDHDGFLHKFEDRVNSHTQVVTNRTNTANSPNRVDRRVYTNPVEQPVRLAHIALWVSDLTRALDFYLGIGFELSDSIRGRCHFMRLGGTGPHHDLLLVQSTSPTQKGMHHLSFEMPDYYSVFTKGIYLSEKGWKTQLGPGRHPISSATFWYFETPLGPIEVTADSDFLTRDWIPQVFEPSVETATEWAIVGGIDPVTRRQQGAVAHTFIEQNRS